VNDIPPNPGYFPLLDISNGKELLIPLNYRETVQGEVMRLMLMSQSQGERITFQSNLSIFADLSRSGNGIATLSLSAAVDMCGGRIRKGDAFYTMVCAVSPRMEMVAWHNLRNMYMKVFTQDLLHPYASFGERPPDGYPWVAGFATPITRILMPAGLNTLASLVHLSAASLVNRCQNTFVPDVSSSVLGDYPDPDIGN